MKFEIGRYSLKIIPEDEQDIAYIEDTLGFKSEDSTVRIVRKHCFQSHILAYLEVEKYVVEAKTVKLLFDPSIIAK
jgi:hypothetical protein